MNIPDRAPGQVRIGIAVAVPEPYSAELAAARSAAGDPLAELIPPHITLLGPTVIDQADLEKVRDHLGQVAGSVGPFEVVLRGTATFRPVSPVVFVALAQGIAECETIESRVRTGMLAQDLRFNYHPHVTIAHEVPDDCLDKAYESLRDFEARFEVASFWQYEHGDDGVWRPQCEFALGH